MTPERRQLDQLTASTGMFFLFLIAMLNLLGWRVALVEAALGVGMGFITVKLYGVFLEALINESWPRWRLLLLFALKLILLFWFSYMLAGLPAFKLWLTLAGFFCFLPAGLIFGIINR